MVTKSAGISSTESVIPLTPTASLTAPLISTIPERVEPSVGAEKVSVGDTRSESSKSLYTGLFADGVSMVTKL